GCPSANRGEGQRAPRNLPYPPLDKAGDDVESAEEPQVLMPALGRKPALFRVRRRREQLLSEAGRDDGVAAAVQKQDRRLYLADPRQRVEAVPHQPRRRDERVM